MKDPGFSLEQQAEWDAWMNDRPPHVRAVVEKYPPWGLYRVVETGQLARIRQYDEQDQDDGTVVVTVRITAWYDWHPPGLPAVGVFGVPPEDLEEIDE